MQLPYFEKIGNGAAAARSLWMRKFDRRGICSLLGKFDLGENLKNVKIWVARAMKSARVQMPGHFAVVK